MDFQGPWDNKQRNSIGLLLDRKQENMFFSEAKDVLKSVNIEFVEEKAFSISSWHTNDDLPMWKLTGHSQGNSLSSKLIGLLEETSLSCEPESVVRCIILAQVICELQGPEEQGLGPNGYYLSHQSNFQLDGSAGKCVFLEL